MSDERISGDGTAALAAALVAAQRVVTTAKRDSTNPHYGSRYADLASVWEACRDPLTSHGIAVVQIPSADGNRVTVTTLLVHASGARLEGALTMTAKDASPQAIGSAITYARRYALMAMVGIAPEDDDGEAAQPARTAPAAEPRHETARPTPAPTPIRAEEIVDGLRVVGVEASPTRKAGVTRYTVELSDGRRLTTIKDLLASVAQRARDAGAAVAVTTKDTPFGVDLVGLDEITDAQIPF